MKEFIFSVLEFLSELGYFGIALGLMIEVIPSEIVLGYGGYMISEGILGYPGAVIAGTIGGTLAQLFLYWAGYYGGRPFLEKYGKYVFIKKKQIDLSEQWFRKYGVGVIFFARFIPVVRHAISIPAGIAKMSATKFTLYTVAAVIPWTILFLYLGHALGENWSHIKEYAAQYTMPIIIGAVILGVIYFLIKKTKKTTTD
ncbi:DedA family protein [Neobacillus sp. 3P2-tot-E-2]|jgi:membrane protein DedA with SNARE-associated domain|uniref:DedA family protein n=1 Tax=Neobacillus driksii TaxID=3035913 RepID=A0ABV4Z1S2_9BACI|nr:MULTISPECIES: DedA family protein [Neobacillus]MDF2787470.1 rane protein [Neobacillus sp.]MDP5197837.1 DedA family protein [Neobacillus sp. 179.-C4.2 HS]MDQ0976697.1 membrane protein DedA with SNARE-associated domain [Neobacillus niacini]